LNAVADRERVFGDPRPAIDDYATVDLVLRRERIAGHLDLSVLVRNLFDEDVREPSTFVPGLVLRFIDNDLPQAGRAAFVELRYRF
jgi:iron complex outermembrane receptor protein